MRFPTILLAACCLLTAASLSFAQTRGDDGKFCTDANKNGVCDADEVSEPELLPTPAEVIDSPVPVYHHSYQRSIVRSHTWTGDCDRWHLGHVVRDVQPVRSTIRHIAEEKPLRSFAKRVACNKPVRKGLARVAKGVGRVATWPARRVIRGPRCCR